jgi:hypothetical protein
MHQSDQHSKKYLDPTIEMNLIPIAEIATDPSGFHHHHRYSNVDREEESRVSKDAEGIFDPKSD